MKNLFIFLLSIILIVITPLTITLGQNLEASASKNVELVDDNNNLLNEINLLTEDKKLLINQVEVLNVELVSLQAEYNFLLDTLRNTQVQCEEYRLASLHFNELNISFHNQILELESQIEILNNEISELCSGIDYYQNTIIPEYERRINELSEHLECSNNELNKTLDRLQLLNAYDSYIRMSEVPETYEGISYEMAHEDEGITYHRITGIDNTVVGDVKIPLFYEGGPVIAIEAGLISDLNYLYLCDTLGRIDNTTFSNIYTIRLPGIDVGMQNVVFESIGFMRIPANICFLEYVEFINIEMIVVDDYNMTFTSKSSSGEELYCVMTADRTRLICVSNMTDMSKLPSTITNLEDFI